MITLSSKLIRQFGIRPEMLLRYHLLISFIFYVIGTPSSPSSKSHIIRIRRIHHHSQKGLPQIPIWSTYLDSYDTFDRNRTI
jgi:hypothetical protein